MKTTLPLLCMFALAACTGKPPEPQAAPQPAADQASTAHSTATPWDALKQDEQRAKNVQKVVNQQAEQQRKQIEAQTQ